MWKTNIRFLIDVTRNANGMIVNYASALFILLVLSQIHEKGLFIYGILSPYILIALAFMQSSESAVMYLTASKYCYSFWKLVIIQVLISVLYLLGAYPLSQLSPALSVECSQIVFPLVEIYSVNILSSVFFGILRGHGHVGRINVLNSAFLISLIIIFVYHLVGASLTPLVWLNGVLIVTICECVAVVVLSYPYIQKPSYKLNWHNNSKRYFTYATPILLGWMLIAFDRFMVNRALLIWGADYVAYMATWFQVRPLLLFPAIAAGQIAVSRLYHMNDHGIWKRVAPAYLFSLLCVTFFSALIAIHSTNILDWISPQSGPIAQEMRWIIISDVATIPVLSIVIFSRTILESRQYNWNVFWFLFFSILISKGIYLPLFVHQKSVMLLSFSFILQAIIALSIPLFLFLRRSQYPVVSS